MSESIYLDYQSTTPCEERVVEAMLPFMSEQFQNASSITHASGRRIGEVVEKARAQVAQLIGAQSRDLLFTSSATEANNLVFQGLKGYKDRGRNKVLVSSIEHASVLNPAKQLEQEGFEVVLLKVHRDGRLDLKHLVEHMDDSVLLLSVGQGNNEVGVLQDLKTIASYCREHGAFFHVDATQALLTEEIDVDELHIDLLSMSAHKLYGPKGVGALYRRRKQPRVRLKPILLGGEQEWGLRAGSLNVPGIVGLAKACEIVMEERERDRAHFSELKRTFVSGLKDAFPKAWVNGSLDKGLSHNLHFGIPGLDAQKLMCEMPEIECSKGSTCSLDLHKPSHVLLALGLNADQADSCLRFGLGRRTKKEDLQKALEALCSKVPLCLKRDVVEVMS